MCRETYLGCGHALVKHAIFFSFFSIGAVHDQPPRSRRCRAVAGSTPAISRRSSRVASRVAPKASARTRATIFSPISRTTSARAGRFGFRWRLVDNPAGGAPLLIAERHEDDALPTVLTYGHGDVVPATTSNGATDSRRGRSSSTAIAGTAAAPPTTRASTAINLAALARVLAARGRLGFNVKLLLEMGEETGSPGLRAVCERERDGFPPTC